MTFKYYRSEGVVIRRDEDLNMSVVRGGKWRGYWDYKDFSTTAREISEADARAIVGDGPDLEEPTYYGGASNADEGNAAT